MDKKIIRKLDSIKNAISKAQLASLLTLAETAKDDNLIVTSFAACYKAVEQGLGLSTFDEQLLAAIALADEKVVQMSTGEGKTISAVYAAFYHTLRGENVHVLTFNDYLAKRDYLWMKPVYDILGVSTAYICEQSSAEERKAAYKAQVLYVSAKECCFDFLRDFTAQDKGELVCGEFCCAIVDEADSILIDEARIPLVVAGNVAVKQSEDLPEISAFISGFSESDYETSLESNTVYLTPRGAHKTETHYGIENLYDDTNSDLLMKINDSLKAWFWLKEDKDYIVKDGQIQLIDEFTGRIAKNRHYPGSLQAAVEIKHGVTVSSRGTIMGTIPLQFFIRQYPSLAGMTGTALSAKDEFYELYDLDLEIIPPHKPSMRIDHPIDIYYDNEAKWKAIVKAVRAAFDKKQPVLIGVQNIDDSERLKASLERYGIRNISVLNAKNDEMEAEIIKNAGALGSVTISANMAGRGVDIKLGGADEKTRDDVISAGGLLVVSTYMAESERINNQLIGRSGRQGDVGESRRFVSLDEPIMDKFKLKSLVPSRHYPAATDALLSDKILAREVGRLQRISAGYSLDERKRLLKFTMIGEKHRTVIFDTRRRFLMGEIPSMWESDEPEKYEAAVERFGEKTVDELERKTAIAKINSFWCDYLEYTASLREGIHLAVIAGKSPAEEYNISVEGYYSGMENALRDSMDDSLDELLRLGADKYEITVPQEIWTYFLEDAGDELSKKQFMTNQISDEEYAGILAENAGADEDYQDDAAEAEYEEAGEETTAEDAEQPKKGLFKGLFRKK